jgi:hypothetical protein
MIPILRKDFLLLRKRSDRTNHSDRHLLFTNFPRYGYASPKLPGRANVIKGSEDGACASEVFLARLGPFHGISERDQPRFVDLSAEYNIKTWDHLYSVCKWQRNLQERQINPVSPGVLEYQTRPETKKP